MIYAYLLALLAIIPAAKANMELAKHDEFSSLFKLNRLYEDVELEENDKPLVISLGANCISAYQALVHGIRSASYPFDWLVSDIESIYINLDENFLHFLDKEYCSFTGNWIVNRYDNIKFLHEFHELGEKAHVEFLPLIQTKYLRRIQRFRQLKKQKKVFFMRYATCPAEWTTQENKDTAVQLRNKLNNFFESKLDFVLVMLGGEDYYKDDWQIEGIKNYYISELWNAVASDLMKQNLTEIFKDLKLIP
jgi:hypothetical protein